ncbi:MAG: hypothetical protein U1E65_03890 [Myxococcota bacterium]
MRSPRSEPSPRRSRGWAALLALALMAPSMASAGSRSLSIEPGPYAEAFGALVREEEPGVLVDGAEVVARLFDVGDATYLELIRGGTLVLRRRVGAKDATTAALRVALVLWRGAAEAEIVAAPVDAPVPLVAPPLDEGPGSARIAATVVTTPPVPPPEPSPTPTPDPVAPDPRAPLAATTLDEPGAARIGGGFPPGAETVRLIQPLGPVMVDASFELALPGGQPSFGPSISGAVRLPFDLYGGARGFVSGLGCCQRSTTQVVGTFTEIYGDLFVGRRLFDFGALRFLAELGLGVRHLGGTAAAQPSIFAGTLLSVERWSFTTRLGAILEATIFRPLILRLEVDLRALLPNELLVLPSAEVARPDGLGPGFLVPSARLGLALELG